MKKTMHMIGNAHLDPVWLWNWQEGFTENKATVKSALDRIEEYDEFIFTASSALFFEWIENNDTPMFEKIKTYVAQGKIVLCGGWLIEPDCNIPSGESFIRQALYGQNYFNDKFGKIAVTGYNVDSFGHNWSLPQLLVKSGLKQYVFMRPMNHEYPTKGSIFNWQGPDGTEILTYRLPYTYTANMHLDAHINECTKYFDGGSEDMMCFYGVGNHGGGPTKRNIELIKSKKIDGYSMVFSSPDAFFDCVRKAEHSTEKGCLLHHASGCYGLNSEIKALNRKAETALINAEAFCALTVMAGLKKYPDNFDSAWKSVLFNQFHDILAGSSIKQAYEDTRHDLGKALSISAENQNWALQKIASCVNIDFEENAQHIIVFNPHSYGVNSAVEIEGGVHDNNRFEQNLALLDDEGKTLDFQRIHANTFMWDRNLKQRRLTFDAFVPPLGYRVYKLIAQAESESVSKYPKNIDALENEFLRVTLDNVSGGIKSIYDKKLKRELLKANAFCGTVIKDLSDTWSHGVYKYDEVIGNFKHVKTEIAEWGKKVCSLRMTSKFEESILVQTFILREGRRELEIKVKMDYRQPQTVCKLMVPSVIKNKFIKYEIPFAYYENRDDGYEFPIHTYTDLSDGDFGFSMINNVKTASNFFDGTLGVTIARTPPFAYDLTYNLNETDYCEYVDMGIQEFSLLLCTHGAFNECETVKRAREFNNPLIVQFEYAHNGTLPLKKSFINISADNVIISAFKKALKTDEYILRLYECGGKKTAAKLQSELFKDINFDINPYEIKTFAVGKGKAKEINLIELEEK